MTRETKYKVWDKFAMRFITNIHIFPNGEVRYYDNILNPKDIEVCFFIGFKDKNGKEIYEGDIVEVTDKNGWGKKIIITYNKGYYNLALFSNKKIEVIGNKFENPELLK